MQPNLDNAPAATVVLGKQVLGESDQFVQDGGPSSPYESFWFTMARAQAAKPFTVTAMVTETQDENKFLTFIGGVLSDDTVKSSLTKGVQVLVMPSEAAKANLTSAVATRSAQSLADEKFAAAPTVLQTCEASSLTDAPTNGAAATAALRDFLSADQDPTVKHRGTVTDPSIATIDIGKPATVGPACKAICFQMVQ